MQYARLGKTGLKVSRICLGCMSFGSKEWVNWVLEEEESLKIIKAALDAGINFFDTANVYSHGESERILAKAFKKFNVPREEVVIATKLYFGVGKTPGAQTFSNPSLIAPNGRGLSRKHIFEAVEASLKRLETSYIDLYQIHRWDSETPIEETMEALHDLVKMGKVRYIGASSMWTYQFAKAQYIAKERGWTQFVSMQNLYNLLYREEEREMIPLCQDLGVGLIPWSPLARGVLSDPKPEKSNRAQTDKILEANYVNIPEHVKKVDDEILNRARSIAAQKGVSTSQVAIAWMLTKPTVAAPIVGVSKLENLEDILGALKVKLTEEEIKQLEEPYIPKKIMGHM